MGVKCTTSNEREVTKCFYEKFTFLFMLSYVRYDLFPFKFDIVRLISFHLVELRSGMLMHAVLT